jgi:PAS domain S-box-containing protein
VRHTGTHARKTHGSAGEADRLRRENARLRAQLRESQSASKGHAGALRSDRELSTSLLQAVLEAVADGIVAVDTSGLVTTYNRKLLDLWGLPESVFASRRFETVLDAALQAAVHPEPCRARFIEIFSQPEMISHDMVELKDGRILERHSLPQRLGEAIVGRVASYRDVTERIRAERELRRSEELFKTVFFGIPDLAGIVDLASGQFVEVNDGCERLLGWRREEIVGRRAGELPIWPNREERSRIIHEIERAGEVSGLEFALCRKDGRPCHVSGSARVLEIRGRPSIVLLLRDVSEQRRLEGELRRLNTDLERRVSDRTAELEREVVEHRRTEESLRRSERRYRELVQSANSIILRWDTEGRITFLNEFGQAFFGLREEEYLGHPVIGTIVPESESSGRDLVALMRHVAHHPEDHTVNENENVRRDGERVWIAWTNRPVYGETGELVETLSVGNDITLLKNAERELKIAKEAAESADRLKSEFLANMSHELRTPLNSIIGFTGLLIEGLAGPVNEEQAKQLGMVQNSSRHLLALINDVLDLSKIAAGQLNVQKAPFDFRESATRAVMSVQPLAEKKGLRLRLEVAPEVGTVVSDRRRVEQVLMNLLSNAIKFTDRGEVAVATSISNGDVLTSVRDTGLGVKPEDQPILFRPFQQVDIGLARTHDGTGLGLSICRKLLDLLGGSIDFTSAFGVGSVFTFRIPVGAGGQP